MSNYSPIYMPKLVSSPLGTNRATQKYVALGSATIYIGSFVALVEGTLASPTGVTGSVQPVTDDDFVLGFVTNICKKDSNVPIWEDTGYAGTFTAATGDLPPKYAFHASNVGTYDEMVEVMPIFPEDTLEVALWGGSTAAVARGTTTGSGTMGYGMSINTTYTFALLESTSSTTLTNLDFVVVAPNKKQPVSSKKVYAQCHRCNAALNLAD